MKKIILALLLSGSLGSCRHHDTILIYPQLADSLIEYYSVPGLVAQNVSEGEFWQSRISPAVPGFLNESRYAACLSLVFRLTGEIDSLKKADSVLQAVDSNFRHREASVDLALVSNYITEHRFREADSILRIAKRLGLRPYESHACSFDIAFERGEYLQARAELNAIRSPNDFGYFFRRSKLDHFDGRLDSAISSMERAGLLCGTNDFLKGTAQANAGDLYLHAEDAVRARDAYWACIRRNRADFHSWIGLGWIALVHDGDARLANTIYQFVRSKNPLPDALFRLAQVAGVLGDSTLQRQYASSFAAQAERPVYGRMYHKYLIQLYTGVLCDPAAAEELAKKELDNRATPQVYAWYCWALMCNGRQEEAYALYRQKVSGQPLEALELYWMGRLMEGLGKNYNATEFYKAAEKSRYDLDPADAAYIRKKLEE